MTQEESQWLDPALKKVRDKRIILFSLNLQPYSDHNCPLSENNYSHKNKRAWMMGCWGNKINDSCGKHNNQPDGVLAITKHRGRVLAAIQIHHIFFFVALRLTNKARAREVTALRQGKFGLPPLPSSGGGKKRQERRRQSSPQERESVGPLPLGIAGQEVQT